MKINHDIYLNHTWYFTNLISFFKFDDMQPVFFYVLFDNKTTFYRIQFVN